MGRRLGENQDGRKERTVATPNVVEFVDPNTLQCKDLELQSNQVKRTPQDSIYYLKNESVSRSRNWVVAKTKTPEN